MSATSSFPSRFVRLPKIACSMRSQHSGGIEMCCSRPVCHIWLCPACVHYPPVRYEFVKLGAVDIPMVIGWMSCCLCVCFFCAHRSCLGECQLVGWTVVDGFLFLWTPLMSVRWVTLQYCPVKR